MPRFLSVAAALLALVLLVGAQAASPPPRLRLQRASFDARLARTSASQAEPSLASTVAGYSIVQFNGPISAAERATLLATGVELLEYLPDYAYLVRGGSPQLARSARLPGVYAQVPLTTADKLAPALLRALTSRQYQPQRLAAYPWPGQGQQLAAELRATGIDVNTPLDRQALLRVAALASLRWIEPASTPRLLNEQARTIMHVDQVRQDYGLYGAGQVVAVADSGLDTGNPATLSPDFAGRIKATHVLSAGGDLADTNGHGTHVAGSIAGAGVQSGAKPGQRQYAGSYAGVAPEAQLVVQAFEATSAGEIIGLDPDTYKLLAQAYASGARLHSDSWGDYTGPTSDPEAQYGGYTYAAQRVDQFLWEHPDMTTLFAAGNSGSDGTPSTLGFCTGSDGVVDPDSLLAPATAKNVISVGASESQRSSGGLAAAPWLLISFCFGVQPIATDTVSNNPDGMAAFSSRGPTDDGRIKPDIVAPGTNIISNRSQAPGAGTLWGAHESNTSYSYSGGTSMATPLTAGVAALARQWLTTRGLANPSAAAVKATLLNTTRQIAPGQYGSGAQQEIPLARPNSVAGWGRADLGFIGAAGPYSFWIDDHTSGLATGAVVEYSHTSARPLEVTSSSQPLRVMLAWTDAPASLSAAAQLVNDLDLVLIGPGGVTYRGNNGPSADRLNNVEGIVLETPPLGRYRIEVRAHNVPIDGQPYALVVGGPLRAPGGNPVPTVTPLPTSSPTATASPTATQVPAKRRKVYLPLALR